MSYQLSRRDNPTYLLPVFEIKVRQGNSEVSFWTTADRADADAKKLSLMMPDATVFVGTLARWKAIYEKGERIKLTDYHDFYSNLSEEEYKATLIQDCRTAEWI